MAQRMRRPAPAREPEYADRGSTGWLAAREAAAAPAGQSGELRCPALSPHKRERATGRDAGQVETWLALSEPRRTLHAVLLHEPRLPGRRAHAGEVRLVGASQACGTP